VVNPQRSINSEAQVISESRDLEALHGEDGASRTHNARARRFPVIGAPTMRHWPQAELGR
jgi:hypothetical protein